MNKDEVREKLVKMFNAGMIGGWLARFDNDHVFDKDAYTKEFIKYIDSLNTDAIREGM